MISDRLPSAAVGNGQLLVTIDAWGEILSSCWPCIDSPNQMPTFRLTTALPKEGLRSAHFPTPQFGYVEDTNIFSAATVEGLFIQDAVVDIPLSGEGRAVDVHVRFVEGPHPTLTVYIIPELDGRSNAQTIYWDGDAQALVAFCRHNWVAIGAGRGQASDFHCGRRNDESSAAGLLANVRLPGERIAFRQVDGALRIVQSTKSTNLYAVYGRNREEVLSGLEAARTHNWPQIKQLAQKAAQSSLTEMTLRGATAQVDSALRRSSLVLDLLTNRSTGGVIAGPDVQSGIASAPGYAAVWARDAAWTALGALAMGRMKAAKRMLIFAIKTQSPEGLWLHRHHSDYGLASSWGLHQIDETGILLHTIVAYIQSAGDKVFVNESWPAVLKAANFLCLALDSELGLPVKSVDLWEEREGFHAYTAASVIAGLKSAAILAAKMKENELAQHWTTVAEEITKDTLVHFWKPKHNRFVSSIQSSPALPIIDSDRPELSAEIQRGGGRPETALAQYPNWRANTTVDVSLGHDISVLALAVPFGILPLNDPRITTTVTALRKELWNTHIGGLSRYEGDSYGGGNPWPLATLWLAIYEGACANVEEAQNLIDWVVSHSTAAGLVPEQVHKENGRPVAAVPLSWSHAMIAIAAAAINGQQVWRVVSGRDKQNE